MAKNSQSLAHGVWLADRTTPKLIYHASWQGSAVDQRSLLFDTGASRDVFPGLLSLVFLHASWSSFCILRN